MGIMLKSSIAYEPALDGLRAVAILAVFVFHRGLRRYASASS